MWNRPRLHRMDTSIPNHIAVTGLKADVTIPRLRNDDIIVYLKRLSLAERSGPRAD